MARDLRGKVLLVTGASSGIGAATALEAGRAGMRVMLAARRAAKLEAVAQRVRDAGATSGAEAATIVTDITSEAQVRRMIDATVQRFGRIDVLFANAGFGYMHEMAGEQTDAEIERRMWETNYFGTLRCARAAAAVMKRQGRGHILVCSSIVGRIGLPFYGTYSATKAALHAATAAMALELECDSIDVSGVYPSGTRSEFFETVAGLSGCDGISANTPGIFIQSAESVARRIVGCMRRPRPEVWPSLFSRVGTVMWTLSPRLYRFCFRFHTRWCRKTINAEVRGQTSEVSQS